MLRPMLLGTLPLHARPQATNGVEPPPEPSSVPAYILVGTALGAVNGALLLWQVSWSQEQANMERHVGRGALFGAGLGAVNGLLLGILAQGQQTT